MSLLCPVSCASEVLALCPARLNRGGRQCGSSGHLQEVPQSDHEAPKPAPQPETVQWCSLKEALETNWNQLWKPPQKANKLGCILQGELADQVCPAGHAGAARRSGAIHPLLQQAAQPGCTRWTA